MSRQAEAEKTELSAKKTPEMRNFAEIICFLGADRIFDEGISIQFSRQLPGRQYGAKRR